MVPPNWVNYPGGNGRTGRQWLLLSRRSKYEMDGKHKLFLTAGGSLGQAYQLALDVDEGPMDKDDISGTNRMLA